MPASPTAVIQRLVLRTMPTAVRKPCSTGPTGHATRAVEVDLPRGQAAGAELVLQAAEGEPVRRAVELAGDHEAAQPPGAVGGRRRPGR